MPESSRGGREGQMLGGCVCRLGISWLSDASAPLQDLTCCLVGRRGARRGWWEVGENPQSNAVTGGFRAWGESKVSASSPGARDAYCLECAGGAGSTRRAVAGPPLRAAARPRRLGADRQIRAPPPRPRDHLVSPGPRHSLLTHCITLLQSTRRAVLFAFDLPVQLNYWHGELFSRVWGSRPGYRLPTRPPTNLARDGREGRLHRGGEGFPARPLGVRAGSGAVGAGASPGTSGWNPGTRRPSLRCLAAECSSQEGRSLWRRRRSQWEGRVKAPELRSGSLAGSWAAAGEPSQIPGESSEEEHASASTQALLPGGEAREVNLRSAGSGLVEVLLGCASFPQPSTLTSGAPEERRGLESTRKRP